MQLYLIDWSFQNSEDQLFATNKFCELLKQDKINQFMEGLELINIVHAPQNGSGVIICKAQSSTTLLDILSMWRENFSISFNITPALTSEELLQLQSSKDF